MSRIALRMALLAATIIVPSLAARHAQAAEMAFKATLSGAQEVPAKTTDGKGDFLGTLDTATKTLSYTLTYTGLSGPATAAHIHGPAAAGANAGVVVPFASPASPITGKVMLTDAQIADLEAGKMYANVHTAANPGGEIRGQITK